ncbi:MAG: hypothetical protein A3J83_03085 [Elusimicrobia bacterium RIFOXYA2_FULL_40_6]|nr:MAG: hypothetical protein A3J83_03085 [Elusimicrobia bacterium RIFOXYA2_FULL_40_6]
MRETHNTIRNTNSWDKAVDLLYELKTKYKKFVKLAFVFQKDNYLDFNTLSKFMKKEGIPIDILCYSSGGMGQPGSEDCPDYKDGIDNVLRELPADLIGEDKIKYLKLVKNKIEGKLKSQKCIVPSFKFMVDAKGNVYPCSAWEKPVGNVLKAKSFSDIWKSYSNLRKKIRQGNHPWCIKCRSCELTINSVVGLGYLKKRLKKFI